MPSRSSSSKSDRSSRSKDSRSKSKPVSAVSVSAWVIRIYAMLLILALPWYFGCATWTGQYVLFIASAVLCCLLVVHCSICIAKKKGDLRIPKLSWLFFGIGTYAFLQSIPIFSWDSQSTLVPSIQMQRWALGLTGPPKNIEGTILMGADKVTKSYENVPCDLKQIEPEDRRLAWSIDPLHTRGAFFSLFLCGLMVWVGRLVFSESDKQLWLFGVLTLIGVIISCVGIQGAISYKAENFLGLKSGNSFATFVSKNSAGSYLNVCIAGCLGLLGWTLLNTQRKSNDMRYRFPDSSLFLKIRGAFEDLLADLNTPQIASMLCLVAVVSSMLISLCRGAAVSALAGLIAATIIANAKSRSRGGWVITCSIVIAAIASLVGFQLDDRAFARLESLSELDIESEFRQGRAYIWTMAWRAAQYYGLLGSGLGTFHFAYLPFQDPASPAWFYHAESLYSQCSVDLGFIGLFASVIALFFVMAKIQRAVPTENWSMAFPAKLSGAYLIFSQAVHSFVDFAQILPSLFVPTCLMLGSVNGLLDWASKVPPAKRSSGRPSESTETAPRKAPTGPRHGLIGIGVSLVSILAIWIATGAVSSLALSETMATWTKNENAKSFSSQLDNRVDLLEEMASIDADRINQNPEGLRVLAEASIFDYRKRQLNMNPPQGDWKPAWRDSSPLYIRLALSSVNDVQLRGEIIDAVGGNAGLEDLRLAANWYARAHTKSPLDWRLVCGRSYVNLQCSMDEMATLLPVCNQLSRHGAQNLLTHSMIYRNLLTSEEMAKIRSQAMKSNPGTSQAVAQMVAADLKDGEVPIDIFPQRADTLEELTKTVFTREKFPKTNLMIWQRARSIMELTNPNNFDKAIWLARYSEAIGDTFAKINYLKLAVAEQSRNVPVLCRLARSLKDADDETGAKEFLRQARDVDPLNPEVLALKQELDPK